MFTQIKNSLEKIFIENSAHSPSPARYTACAGIQSGKVEDGINDMLAIDVSGSMALSDYRPTRLAAAKQACQRFMDEELTQQPDAAVGVTSFSDRGHVVCHLAAAGDYEADIRKAIDGLRIGGSTNTADGLLQAADGMVGVGRRGRFRIILLTDGMSNDGVAARGIAEGLKRRGIQLDIIGIGGSPAAVNEIELREMASVVDGELRYWFIHDVDSLVHRFQSMVVRSFEAKGRR